MELLGIGVSSMQEIQRPPRDDEAASDVCPQCASPDPLLTLMTTASCGRLLVPGRRRGTCNPDCAANLCVRPDTPCTFLIFRLPTGNQAAYALCRARTIGCQHP
jgi:hypothetical protein